MRHDLHDLLKQNYLGKHNWKNTNSRLLDAYDNADGMIRSWCL